MKRRFVAILFAFCGILFLIHTSEADENEVFHNANQEYDKGEYETAVRDYSSLVSQGYESSDLHFNLGNAYFKSGKIGQSIFHYRRALELSPRDGDIKFNLNYAREKVADQVENHESFVSKLFGFADAFSEREAYLLLAGVALGLLTCGLIGVFRPYSWIRPSINLLAVLGIAVGLVVFHHSIIRSKFGVIAAPEAKVYSGVGTDSVVLFAIHEGVEFAVAEVLDADWVRIRLADGKQGWIKTESVVIERSS